MFCDEVLVAFIAGRGGNGAVSFRREKYIARGGPNGGDGGKGGSIFLQANENINTLAEFNTHKIFRAEPGEKGKSKDMGGADSPDLFLPVPVGTVVFDEKKKKIFGDLAHHGDTFLVARGGRGGFGNAHFKSSTRQAPRFAELGEPGEEKKCRLELKLVADIGFIGFPSVGKSTLLSRISAARPKIAAYHFTTLTPNLGLVTLQPFGGDAQQNFLACDLPGLIEDAHKGKGLGIRFLKHVARNRVLVHLIESTTEDPVKEYRTIRRELRLFDQTLTKKPEIVVLNKIDAASAASVRNHKQVLKKKCRGIKEIVAISCVTGAGIKELVWKMWNVLEKAKKKTALAAEKKPLADKESFKIFRPHLEEDANRFGITILKKKKRGSTFAVTGPRITQIVVMTDFKNPEAVARVYDVLERTGISKELRRAGAQFGDEIKIGGQTIVYRWE